MAKKPYKPLTKSRKNNSGKKSTAKVAAENRIKMQRKSTNIVKTKRPGRERIARGIPYMEKPLVARAVKQLPETAMIRKGMTLRQLIKHTPYVFKHNAAYVEAARVDVKHTQTGRPVVYGRMVTYLPWEGGRIRRVHEAYLVGMGDDFKVPVNRHRKMLAQCGCESFVFTFEYANAANGCSRLIYSNGQPPNVTNPGLSPGLCKHLIALAKIAIEKNL